MVHDSQWWCHNFIVASGCCGWLRRRPCGFDLVFLEQTVSLIADEDADTHYLMQARAQIARRCWCKVGACCWCEAKVLWVLAGVGAVEVKTAPG